MFQMRTGAIDIYAIPFDTKTVSPSAGTFQSTLLGATGLRVRRLGVASSYGVPAQTVEQAFEQGVNYFYWGTLRSGAFAEAIRNLSPHRDRLVLVVQSYSRSASLVAPSLERALRAVCQDRADILL